MSSFCARITLYTPIDRPGILFVQLKGKPPDCKGEDANKNRNSKLWAPNLWPDVPRDVDQRFIVHGPLLRHGFAEVLHRWILHGSEGHEKNITHADGEQQEVVLMTHGIEGERELIDTSEPYDCCFNGDGV